MKDSPPKGRAWGFAAMCQARTSSAAPRLARTISRVTGTYFVRPDVVPEDNAR